MNPNIIIVVVDALRSDRVGAMGGKDLTPHIDALATESAIFTNAFSTSNATDVAITSIQTGRYPLSHGVVNHGSRVTDKEKVIVENSKQLPEILSGIGYKTGKFGRPLGRWHRNGFDVYPSSMESRVAFDVENPNSMKYRIGNVLESIHPDLQVVASQIHRNINNIIKRNFSKSPSYGDGSYYNNTSDEVIDNFKEFIKEDSPTYSFIHTMDTHAPYAADPKLVKSYLDKFDYNVESIGGISNNIPEHFHNLVYSGEFPNIKEKYYLPDGSPSSAVINAHYDAAVTEADKRVGEIVSILKEQEIFDDSLVVFLSDHGESLTEHGIYYDHHGLYDVSTKVPLIIKFPNGSDGEYDNLVQITDIFPTILDYIDLTDQSPNDGKSLTPLLEDGRSINRTLILAEEAHTQRRRMVRTKKEKLIYLTEGDTICRYCDIQHASEEELYDLVENPNETENIASRNPDKVEELKSEGEELAHSYKENQVNYQDDTVEYDDEDEVYERLEALGYQ